RFRIDRRILSRKHTTRSRHDCGGGGSILLSFSWQRIFSRMALKQLEAGMKRLVCATVLMLGVCGSALAQSAAEGTIRGIIHDEQGGVLPGVTVSATSPTVAGTFTA